jgi:hypothetical protein
MSNLIVNAAAPVDTITITVDNRTNPPDIKFSSSRPLPGAWVVKIMAFCISGLMDMLMRGASGTAGPSEPAPVEKTPAS